MAPALLGFSFFLRPSEAFEALLGEASSENTEHTRRGNREEARIADAFARRMGLRLREVGIYPHGEQKWIAASPDRLVVGSGHVVEVKSTSSAPSLSDAWLMQVTLQLACVGVQTGYLVAQHAATDRELVVWRVRFDRELFTAMVELLEPIHAAAKTAIRDYVEDQTEMPFVSRMGLQDLKGILSETRRLYISRLE